MPQIPGRVRTVAVARALVSRQPQGRFFIGLSCEEIPRFRARSRQVEQDRMRQQRRTWNKIIPIYPEKLEKMTGR